VVQAPIKPIFRLASYGYRYGIAPHRDGKLPPGNKAAAKYKSRLIPSISAFSLFQFDSLNTRNMAPPSKLAIATSSLRRLVKEEASYHKELEQQEARIKKLEADMSDQNAEYQLRQEVQSLNPTGLLQLSNPF
jgi:hypothetical protein